MKMALLFLLLPLSANASFLCDGRKLVTDEGETYNFNTERDCANAVNNSKNGFICDGRKMIVSSGKIYSFSRESDCNAAVSNSN